MLERKHYVYMNNDPTEDLMGEYFGVTYSDNDSRFRVIFKNKNNQLEAISPEYVFIFPVKSI